MEKPNRIVVVDALRGFALLGILLLHAIEHFELFIYPKNNDLFVKIELSILLYMFDEDFDVKDYFLIKSVKIKISDYKYQFLLYSTFRQMIKLKSFESDVFDSKP